MTDHENAPADDAWNQDARNETPAQRLDRNFGELLQELRVAQTGVQILFAFLLMVAFQQRYTETTSGQRVVYGLTIGASALAMALLVAPVALHRLTFRQRIKAQVVAVAHVLTLVGLLFMLLAIVGAVGFVAWFALPDAPALVVVIVTAATMVGSWLVLPLVLRVTADRMASHTED